MVHNGIEYADMQFIAEAFDVLRSAGFTPAELADVFREWNTGDLDSYLIEITSEVLAHVDADTGKPFVEIVEDAAEQKGTGRWTVQIALELGVPVNTIAESVFARSTSGHAALRKASQGTLPGPSRAEVTGEERTALVESVRQALWSAKVVAYAQGLDQIRTASDEFGWDVDIAEVAKIWRGGCIIRAQFLNRIADAYNETPDLPVLMAAPYFAEAFTRAQAAWRRVVIASATAGIPAPAFSSSLSYYDGIRADRLPAALVQGQRDFFGAHPYRRIDKEGTFHTLWSGDRTEIEAEDTH
jgi:6-phosphogluconate dehydrogenase